MREIKFRYLWKGKMYFIDLYKDNTSIAFNMFEVRPKTSVFMQFTGLKDKNEKEIYEGDIVTTNIGKCKIVFHKAQFQAESFCGHYHLEMRNQLGAVYEREPVHWGLFNGEIIGNIYENPELLEKSK